MPTARPRYQITETPRVEHALDLAAQRWPGEPRSRLVLRLIDAGGASIVSEAETRRDRRREAIRRTSGLYTQEYGSDYLKNLREDWPA